ncbi:MAG TPA: outer membrane protein assembly factor BamE [Burkholderiales bacterium]
MVFPLYSSRWLVVLAAAAAACSSVPRIPGITPYKMDIQQGNFVSQEMIARLRPGMSREQVRYLLGTPLVTDIFHAERWDYVYWREAPDGTRVERHVALFFSPDNKLERIAGDVVSSAAGR